MQQLKQHAGKHRTTNGDEQRGHEPRKLRVAGDPVFQLPPRPDSSVLNDSIPLFFIGRNAAGCWVARESEGRCGGLFLLRRSAVRYAKTSSAPAVCATMLLNTPLELDLPNRGSRLADSLAVAIAIAERYTPLLVKFLRMAAAEWRNLVQQISRALASERRNRDTIEKELFHGQYTLVSKNDDDLPVPYLVARESVDHASEKQGES